MKLIKGNRDIFFLSTTNILNNPLQVFEAVIFNLGENDIVTVTS